MAWGAIPATTVLVVVVSTGLVGVGEELLIRGVLLVAVRARHGELAALGITSGAFALGHVPGSLVGGMPAPELALQVAYLAVVGAACCWMRRVTGRLWPVMVVHAAVDATVLLGAASGSAPSAHPIPEQTAEVLLAVVQSLLVVAVAAGCVSARREDRRTAAARAAEAAPGG
ncbi:CAAX amino terminal protease self- immunity [Clavibacter michiganensis]|uniref:CAAX amino terminal protease self-immunity n=1 Tax=Clavibacter michiganensis TaxID=28447 RepID=A0A251XX34_9MICO|nr:CAAX amino terminal protease self- immunity [Clavibacter michiganensis]